MHLVAVEEICKRNAICVKEYLQIGAANPQRVIATDADHTASVEGPHSKGARRGVALTE
jgi:hypothetical protein